QVAPFEIMKKHPFSKNLRLEALNYNQFLELKKAMNVQDGNVSLEQIFDETLGISRNIRNFFKVIKDEDSLEFFKRATSQKIDFNEYVIYQLASKLPLKDADILYYLSAIRHPVTRETVDSIIPDDCKNVFEDLIKSSFVYSFEGHLYIKEYFAKQIFAKVSKAQKEKVHTALSTFYGKEIPLKHFERHIKLSRTTLRNEFAYHLKLSEHKKTNEITLRASTLNSDVILYQESKAIPFKEDNTAPKGKNLSAEVMKKAENMAVQNISAHNIQTEVIGAEFSEEERKLLYEEAKELQKVDDDKIPKDKRKKTIIDEIPIEIDFKKSKIIDNTDYYKFLEDALDQEASKNYEKALELYEKAQKVCKIKEKELYIHSKIANAYTKLKKRQEAMQALKSAYMLAKELNDDKKLAYVLLNIAKTLHDFGEYKLAEQHYNDFLDMNILKELPKGQILYALIGLGDLYIDTNQESNALQVYETALKQAGVNHSALNEIYFKIALTFDNMGNMQKAKEFYERGSQNVLTKDSYDKYYSESCGNLGLIFADEGDYTKAISLLHKAYETDKEAGELEAIAQSVSKLADTYFDLKDYKMAQKFYYEKLKTAKELNTPYLLASAYLDVGDVYMRVNNLSKALRAFVLAKKSIGKEISTDSKVKIERRIEFIKGKIDKKEFEAIVGQS
ncbi:MAG: tetratricopeptide repeat protein, partial [bacterium]